METPSVDDTSIPDLPASGALDVTGHILHSLGVNALSGIKGLSDLLPGGSGDPAKAIADYQAKYAPGELSPAGQETIRNTVAPVYRGVQDTFHTKDIGDAYSGGAQSLADLAGKYLGPQAAGVTGAIADTAPMLVTPEGLVGKLGASAVEDAIKQVPHTISMESAGEAHQPSARSFVARHPETGQELGRITVQPRGGTMQVLDTNVDPAVQGQGIGTKLLQRAIDHAHESGMDFGSDTSVTPSAMAPYLKLKDKGYNVSVNPNASEWESPFGLALKSDDGRPVVSVNREMPSHDNRAMVVPHTNGFGNMVDGKIVSTHPDMASAQDAVNAVNSGGFAEGGEVAPVLGDLGALVAKYAPEAEHLANTVIDKGSVTYNPTSGDIHTSGFAVPTHASRSTAIDHAPSPDDIHNFLLTHQDAFDEDPQAAIHVHGDDAGNHFLHVAHVTPDFGAASDVAAQNGLPGFQDLASGEMHPANHAGVPETGFQTDLPVGDAHFSRGVGLADVRGDRTSKGQPVVPQGSVTTPEMQMLHPWWQHQVAAPAGLESVPAQALMWGAYSPYTGVESAIGAPKLEILSTQIGKIAARLGVSPETARDLVITGKAGAYRLGGSVG